MNFKNYSKEKELPCKGQSPEEVKDWVIKKELKAGDVVALRQSHNHIYFTYYISEVEAVTSKGRIVIKNRGSFYKNGKNCFHPKGQLHMIEPTEEVVKAALNKDMYSPV